MYLSKNDDVLRNSTYFEREVSELLDSDSPKRKMPADFDMNMPFPSRMREREPLAECLTFENTNSLNAQTAKDELSFYTSLGNFRQQPREYPPMNSTMMNLPDKENLGGARAVSNESFNFMKPSYASIPGYSALQSNVLKERPIPKIQSMMGSGGSLLPLSDSFLSMTLDKKWNAFANGADATLAPPNMMRPNYQYNPKSTISRNKGCLTWDGYLPPKGDESQEEYSKKVFLGGVPWDTTEEELMKSFSRFGEFKVEWPTSFNSKRNTPKSFLYLIFENRASIFKLLLECTREQHGGSVTYNHQIQSNRVLFKPIQVIPWIVADSLAMYKQQTKLDNRLTVFVGALHGRLYAQALGQIFEELFGDVVYVQIDTDRYKYPIGSGRVTFGNRESYRKAIEENFVTIVAPKFTKKIQIEPYIEEEPCGKCNMPSAPNFCKSGICMEYFCDPCWQWHHSLEGLRSHQPVKRNRKIERY